jgi:hypothetical protein
LFFNLFLLLFPLLFCFPAEWFVPTPFGVLAPSDFLLPALILLLLPGALERRPHLIQPTQLGITFVAFLAWATLGVLLIMRYTPDARHLSYWMPFGLLKIGKFAEYGMFGFLLCRAVHTPERQRRFRLSLYVGSALLSVAVIKLFRPDLSVSSDGKNALSCMLAVLAVFWTGTYLKSESFWHRLSILSLLVLVCAAALFTRGRGGWFGGTAGLAYLLLKHGPPFHIRLRSVALATVIAAATLIIVARTPAVSELLLSTFRAREHAIAKTSEFGRHYGFDDGGRLRTWLHEVQKLPYAPVLGVGFFQRNPSSGLWSTGSHNFLLQIALETGLVGLALLLRILWRLWFGLRTIASHQTLIRSILITAFVLGMSGEYFYGTLVLLCFSTIIGLLLAEHASTLAHLARRLRPALDACHERLAPRRLAADPLCGVGR